MKYLVAITVSILATLVAIWLSATSSEVALAWFLAKPEVFQHRLVMALLALSNVVLCICVVTVARRKRDTSTSEIPD